MIKLKTVQSIEMYMHSKNICNDAISSESSRFGTRYFTKLKTMVKIIQIGRWPFLLKHLFSLYCDFGIFVYQVHFLNFYGKSLFINIDLETDTIVSTKHVDLFNKR